MHGNTLWSGHWLGLLILVPLINLGLLYFIAFSDWPADRKERQDG